MNVRLVSGLNAGKVAPMKKSSVKERQARREWLLAEAEQLRQECNKMTNAERREARQHAFKLIYGTDATAPAGRR